MAYGRYYRRYRPFRRRYRRRARVTGQSRGVLRKGVVTPYGTDVSSYCDLTYANTYDATGSSANNPGTAEVFRQITATTDSMTTRALPYEIHIKALLNAMSCGYSTMGSHFASFRMVRMIMELYVKKTGSTQERVEPGALLCYCAPNWDCVAPSGLTQGVEFWERVPKVKRHYLKTGSNYIFMPLVTYGYAGDIDVPQSVYGKVYNLSSDEQTEIPLYMPYVSIYNKSDVFNFTISIRYHCSFYFSDPRHRVDAWSDV